MENIIYYACDVSSTRLFLRLLLVYTEKRHLKYPQFIVQPHVILTNYVFLNYIDFLKSISIYVYV